MFITHPEFEFPDFHDLFSDDGSRLWQHVELQLIVPVFLVGIAQVDEDGDLSVTRVHELTDVTELAQLAKIAGGRLVTLDVLLPPYMTRKPGWFTAPLHAVWSGTAPNGTFQTVYVSTSGRRYSSASNLVHERQMLNRQLHFRRPGKAQKRSPTFIG
ncbi:MAG: hypothetical protein H6935_08925 [Thiobacillus sp.]|nr:hypothetical protein [Thiobacillus sp.]